MKTVWFAGMAFLASSSALAQSTIYKHVDESGRTTYTNKPMKGAIVVDLDPITTIPGAPGGPPAPTASVPAAKAVTPARLVVTEKPPLAQRAELKPATFTALATVPAPVPKPVENPRRKQLTGDLTREEQSLAAARVALAQEQVNPALIAAVRSAQQATDPTPTQLAQFRDEIDRASGRIRGLQATVVEHEKTVEALRKELDELTP
jgi:hypothetical protein